MTKQKGTSIREPLGDNRRGGLRPHKCGGQKLYRGGGRGRGCDGKGEIQSPEEHAGKKRRIEGPGNEDNSETSRRRRGKEKKRRIPKYRKGSEEKSSSWRVGKASGCKGGERKKKLCTVQAGLQTKKVNAAERRVGRDMEGVGTRA